MSENAGPRVVAFDSMVLAYAVRKTPSQKGKVRRAHLLVAELERDKAVIIIPSVVVTEYLKEIAQDDRDRAANEIASWFKVEAFDLEDTVLASKLWDDGEAHRRREEEGYRNKMKADAMIIAVAINRGAGEFFSEDGDSRKMATRWGLQADSIPQFDLPSDATGKGRLFRPTQ